MAVSPGARASISDSDSDSERPQSVNNAARAASTVTVGPGRRLAVLVAVTAGGRSATDSDWDRDSLSGGGRGARAGLRLPGGSHRDSCDGHGAIDPAAPSGPDRRVQESDSVALAPPVTRTPAPTQPESPCQWLAAAARGTAGCDQAHWQANETY